MLELRRRLIAFILTNRVRSHKRGWRMPCCPFYDTKRAVSGFHPVLVRRMMMQKSHRGYGRGAAWSVRS